jgi:hypothetical protein
MVLPVWLPVPVDARGGAFLSAVAGSEEASRHFLGRRENLQLFFPGIVVQ